MIRAAEALRLILKNARPLAPERVSLARALGRVLAEDIRASGDLPPFDNSSMDGFAVRSRDSSRPGPLKLKETIRAGAVRAGRLGPGEAMKIMTGAPLPQGADAVVAKEAAEEMRGRIRLRVVARAGDCVRRRGEDIRAGSLLLRRGCAIRPYEIALLAGQGQARVPVHRRARAFILSTGDELVKTGAAPPPGKIRDSNGPALAAALSRWGVTAPHRIVKDDPTALKSAFARALDACDVLLVSGGVSVGDFDYTKTVLENLGVEVIFWKVAIKPGKPLLFGRRKGKLVFGLPGNPLSALVCLEEFVRPALDRLQGKEPEAPAFPLSGTAANGCATPKDRRQYLFCRAERSPRGHRLTIIDPQGSAMMGAACRADALALAPKKGGPVKKGDVLSFRRLD